jgi:type I restriction enzyme S subunit
VSTGSTFQSVNRSALEGVIIPCPSRDEQHSIATILEIVQCGVEIEEGVLAGTRELKQAAMRQLFSQIRGDDEALFAEPEPASEPWPIFTLGGLGSIGNGSTPKRTNSAYWDNGTIPWLTSGKIHEQLIAHADELVTELAARECHLPLVPAGSVLVAITGQGKTLGNVAQVLFDTCVSQHLAFVKFTRSDVLPGFVRHVLSSRYERLREIGSTGGTTKGALTCADLRAFPVPLPPFEQQKEIAGSLDAIDQSIQLHARRMHLFQELFRTLLRDLMSGRIRVADLDLSALDEEAA